MCNKCVTCYYRHTGWLTVALQPQVVFLSRPSTSDGPVTLCCSRVHFKCAYVGSNLRHGNYSSPYKHCILSNGPQQWIWKQINMRNSRLDDQIMELQWRGSPPQVTNHLADGKHVQPKRCQCHGQTASICRRWTRSIGHRQNSHQTSNAILQPKFKTVYLQEAPVVSVVAKGWVDKRCGTL